MTLWTGGHQAPLSMYFPSKNTGVGCHFLFQGILPTQTFQKDVVTSSLNRTCPTSLSWTQLLLLSTVLGTRVQVEQKKQCQLEELTEQWGWRVNNRSQDSLLRVLMMIRQSILETQKGKRISGVAKRIPQGREHPFESWKMSRQKREKFQTPIFF